MKNINSFIKKALIITAVLGISTFSFIPLAHAGGDDDFDSYSPSYDSYDSYSPSYDDSYDSYSPSYDTYDSYSPSSDTYDSYSPSYTTDTYDSYSPSYDTYDSYSPSYEDTSYETPSYSYDYEDTSYVAPSYNYAGYTAPSYSYASYQQPVVYQQPPVVYQQPPVVINQPPVYQTLQATCYAPNTNAYENQNVTWVVNASGGNGGYTYTWSGINLNGQQGQSVTTTYNTPGNETATVSVFSNGQTISVNCGSIYVNPPQTIVNNIVASCYANVASAVVGSPVTWNAVVNGGNGNYTYSWTDNNGVGTQNGNGSTFTTTYPTAGSKSPRLTVSSLGSYGYGYGGNGSVTVTCQPITINSGYNAGYIYTYPPANTGSLATLSSVSLSQVPYTGLADSAGFWEFMIGLVLASLAGTWYFMKVYARGKRRYMINLFKKDNLAKKAIA